MNNQSQLVGPRRSGKRLRLFRGFAAAIAVIVASAGMGLVPNGSAWAGGPTWQVDAAYPPSQVAGFTGVTCPAALDCYVVGGGAILKSIDGGLTWMPESVPAGILNLHGISCATPSHCVAVGQTGSAQSVITTSDGGASWNDANLPAGTLGLTGVSCPSASTCEAVGGSTTMGGQALTSSDGGASWTMATIPAGLRMFFWSLMFLAVGLYWCRWVSGPSCHHRYDRWRSQLGQRSPALRNRPSRRRVLSSHVGLHRRRLG